MNIIRNILRSILWPSVALIQIVIGLFFLTCAYSALSAEPKPLAVAVAVVADKTDDPFRAGEFKVCPFAGVNLASYKPLDGQIFTGLGVGYHVTRQVAITAEAAAVDRDERLLDQFGMHFRNYLPFWKTGLAAYGDLGWQHHTTGHLDLMSTGAGLEVRGKRIGAFAGVRWVQDFRHVGSAQILVGGNFRLGNQQKHK
jgi:hypothetical protein